MTRRPTRGRCSRPALLCVVCWWAAGCATSGPMMVVTVPVVDLRTQPATTLQSDLHDPLQETQLLYSEGVRVLRTQEDWSYVEAIEQREFSHAGRWQGYPGWVPSSVLIRPGPRVIPNLVVTDKWAPIWLDPQAPMPAPWHAPLGTRLRADDAGGLFFKVTLVDGATAWMPRESARWLHELRALSNADRRALVIRNALQFLGDRYVWGGRSPQTAQRTSQITGIDCSGLVNLAYRAAGVEIPRDAHEQFLRARRIRRPQVADLVFLSERGNPSRIVHVMLYAGDGVLIEGPGTGLSVRRIRVGERLGLPLDRLVSGTVVDGQTVSCGRYLP